MSNRLQFGPVVIEWDQAVRRPIEVDHEKLNGDCVFVTACPVTFRREQTKFSVTVDKDFPFDGASIPRWFWVLPGFAPIGIHLWAALCHDWLCVQARMDPAVMDRELADATFASILKYTLAGWRGAVMDLAVSAYRRWSALRGALK